MKKLCDAVWGAMCSIWSDGKHRCQFTGNHKWHKCQCGRSYR